MFTIDQIHEAFSKVKSGADFPQFVQDLKNIGVTHYDNYVSNGNTKYYGLNGFELDGSARYTEIQVNNLSSSEHLRHAISIHQNGQTDYPTFCVQAADAGVEKWTIHILEMSVTYVDKNGTKLTVEPISQP